MSVVVRNQQVRPVLPARQLGQVVDVARRFVGGSLGVVAFAFVDDARMTDHHQRFLDRDCTTDVLSFPVDEDERSAMPAGSDDANEPRYWGDVMICTDQAARQARQLGHPYPYELTVLALHGTLHLLGYDHTSDGGIMSRLEHSLRPRCVAAGRSG